MTIDKDIRDKLRSQGIKKGSHEILGLEITVCQFVVVVLSLMSIVFLFVPLFFLKDPRFLALFFVLSFISMVIGIWFWVKKAEICENPEEYER